jgi:hypothetical protein
MKMNMKVKSPIFLIKKISFLNKKRNFSASNLDNLSTSYSPNKQLMKENIEITDEEKKNGTNKDSVKIIQNNNNTNSKKIKWTQNEDNLLIDCVNKYGIGKWNEMKNCFIGRTRKQIRQRYIIIIKKKKISENIEQPISLNTSTLTDDEKTETNKIKETDSFEWNNELDKILLREYFLNKKSWVKISKKIPGSSENSVKNRFYSLLRQLVNKIKKSYKCNLAFDYLHINKETKNNNLIFLINKEIFGNQIIFNNEYNNLIEMKKMLFISKKFNSENLNNASKQKNYSVKILLSFLPELLTDKGIDIEEIVEELNQRKIKATVQIFVIIEKYFNCPKCENNNNISTDSNFDNLKNAQTEKLGKVIKNIDLKIMSKYFYRFRYNTLGI